MTRTEEYRQSYNAILDALDNAPIGRRELLELAVRSFGLSSSELSDDATGCRRRELIAKLGAVLNAMTERRIVLCDKNGKYRRNVDKPVAVRIESCEEEILRMLEASPMTRAKIRERLIKTFRTDETASDKDDSKLMSFTGQILKRLVEERMLKFDGRVYSVAEGMRARLGSRRGLVALRGEYLSLLHMKGGEFFEHYFMTLLGKFLTLSGVKVLESRATGGAEDGGIDGICKTVDCLGFRETILVQTKNRSDFSTETDVRGFWGAVCAMGGSRGIFATSSDFHPMAEKFCDGIDNCTFIDGERLFDMARKASYGITEKDGVLTVDRSIL